MDRYIVISSDCHAGLPPEKYRDYLDPQYRETFDMALPIQIEMTEKAEQCFLIKEINDEWREGVEHGLHGAWDHDQRIRMLDEDGIAGEVVFVDGITERNSPPFGAGLGLPSDETIVPELQWAGARAHNRWLAEFCSQAPERHAGVASIPLLWDIEEAVKEVRWVKESGLKAVLIPLSTGPFEPYHHVKYDPFWRACEDLGIVVNFHSGGAMTKEYFGKNFPEEKPDDYPGAMGVYVSEVFFWTYRPLTFLIWGGVFERFPKLKVAVTETGTSWMLPPYLQLLDHNYHDVHFSAKLGDFRSHLSMSPSDYFKRNVGIGASCIPRGDMKYRHDMGIDQVMWGSDYPHPEGTWPSTRDAMIDTFHGLPDEEVTKMLGENAIKFYGFDREKLVPIAERIGPTKAEIKPAA